MLAQCVKFVSCLLETVQYVHVQILCSYIYDVAAMPPYRAPAPDRE